MEIKTDFLIIGSGIAGLSLAIKVAQLGSVAIVTKKEKSESNTNYAQGGIAAVTDKTDSFEEHISDTLECGAGLCRKDVVEFVVREAPPRIQELIEWGVNFTKSEEPPHLYDLGQEGGHHRRRVLHAKDLTGQEIERALHEKVAALKNVRIYENHIGIDLILQKDPQGRTVNCLGAYVLDINQDEIHTYRAKYTILSTGGAGKVYLITTNPDIATGDGIAMAYRAGAKIANMEFIQFHPTCLFHPEAKAFLISEAVRGEGGILKLKNGSTFMEKYHPMKSLAPRDVVAKAIDNEIKQSGDEYVLLDISHRSREFLLNRFPNIYGKCLEFGIDMTREPIPVVPAMQALVARYNKFQACRFGFAAELADPIRRRTEPLGETLPALIDTLAGDADALGCGRQMENLKLLAESRYGDAAWLRATARAAGNLHDLTRAAAQRFAQPSFYRPHT